MKLLSSYTIPFLICLSLFISNSFTTNESLLGRCTGSENCKACTSCSSCKHCSNGGSCGVCVTKRKSKTSPTPTSNPKRTGQCQAITKKGAQCSRSASNSNYCWQHNR